MAQDARIAVAFWSNNRQEALKHKALLEEQYNTIALDAAIARLSARVEREASRPYDAEIATLRAQQDGLLAKIKGLRQHIDLFRMDYAQQHRSLAEKDRQLKRLKAEREFACSKLDIELRKAKKAVREFPLDPGFFGNSAEHSGLVEKADAVEAKLWKEREQLAAVKLQIARLDEAFKVLRARQHDRKDLETAGFVLAQAQAEKLALETSADTLRLRSNELESARASLKEQLALQKGLTEKIEERKRLIADRAARDQEFNSGRAYEARRQAHRQVWLTGADSPAPD